MEAVCPLTLACHCGLFSDNQPTVHWVKRMASKSSAVAGQLIRALALRLKLNRVSPLTPMHIKGTENAITDIPSRSFGSNPAYYCKTNDDLKNLFNQKFPLPHQASWTVFQPSWRMAMRVISVLRMNTSTADEWRRLPGAGKHIGEIGPAMSGLWEWTLTFRKPTTKGESAHSQGLEQEYAQDTTVMENKYALERSLGRSRPLARRSRWPEESTPPRCGDQRNTHQD